MMLVTTPNRWPEWSITGLENVVGSGNTGKS
jgi:hypothetical protein